MINFDEYIQQGEPGRKEKAQAWQTAIGLQDVDGLKVSSYLIESAREHIEGEMPIDEVGYGCLQAITCRCKNAEIYSPTPDPS